MDDEELSDDHMRLLAWCAEHEAASVDTMAAALALPVGRIVELLGDLEQGGYLRLRASGGHPVLATWSIRARRPAGNRGGGHRGWGFL